MLFNKKKQIKEIRDLQEQNIVNDENDEYMIGVYNGIEIALAMLENREPIFKTVTKEPEVIEKKEQSGRTVVSGVRIRRKDM
mgnify:FL=1